MLVLALAAAVFIPMKKFESAPPLKRAALGLAPAVVLAGAAVVAGLLLGQPAASPEPSAADPSSYYDAMKSAPTPAQK